MIASGLILTNVCIGNDKNIRKLLSHVNIEVIK